MLVLFYGISIILLFFRKNFNPINRLIMGFIRIGSINIKSPIFKKTPKYQPIGTLTENPIKIHM